ncbi:MAG TPA: P-loop NTPase fold protein [Jatrophihabitans sp.]|nr:P-loop NTPase fold protein [Jatrophihabitans sp.]
MAAYPDLDWDELSDRLKEVFGWAAACELVSHDVGTRTLLIGILRSRPEQNPMDVLLRHFGIPRQQLFSTLRGGGGGYTIDPDISSPLKLAELPPLTGNAKQALRRASELRARSRVPELDIECLLGGLIDSSGTASRGLARLGWSASFDRIREHYLFWLSGRMVPYATALERDFPPPPARTSNAPEGSRSAPAAIRTETDYNLDHAAEDLRYLYPLDSSTWLLAALYIKANHNLLSAAVHACSSAPLKRLGSLQSRYGLDRLVVIRANVELVIRMLDILDNSEPDALASAGLAELAVDDFAVENLMHMVQYATHLISTQGMTLELHPVQNWASRVDELVQAMQSADGAVTSPEVDPVGVAPTEAATVSTRTLAARYTDDSAATTTLARGDSDVLGIAKDVDMLASVIASRQIQPPLALGIFGAWGSGKSFLMNQLQLKINDLARRSRNQESLFCSDIVHVDFNAWQYSDGHLWASLVNRVFEKLGDHLQCDARYLEALAAIERQDEEVRRAHERVDSARRAVEETQPESHRTVADLVHANPEVTAAATELANRLGLAEATTEITELERQVEEFDNLLGRLRLAWTASTPARRGSLFLGLSVAVLLVLLSVWLPSVGRAISILGAALTAGLTAAVNVIKPTNEVLRAARRVLRADDSDRASYEEAKRGLATAEEELSRLQREGPGGLYRFVQERYEAVDYREYLGMVPLIRADLKRLSEWALPPDGSPQIERIVVYIDDLDRCRAAQVVKILEAVNLLFSFPLFVVVIAVDSRWLLQSLRSELRGIFSGEGVVASSPQDYLEKIIRSRSGCGP